MPSTKTAEFVKATSTTRFDETRVGKLIGTNHCECSHYSFENAKGVVKTYCGSTTGSVFAQGHDAKMKGLLIEAGAQGIDPITQRYFVETGTIKIVTETWKSIKTGVEKDYTYEVPEVEAKYRTIGIKTISAKHNFGHQVNAGIAAAQAKVAKRAIKAGKKADADKAIAAVKEANGTEVEAPAETPAEVTPTQVKVGRWWYDIKATQNGQYVYFSSKGDQLSVPVLNANVR